MNLNPRVFGANFAVKGLRSARVCTFRLAFTASERRLRSGEGQPGIGRRRNKQQARRAPRHKSQPVCLGVSACFSSSPAPFPIFFLPLQSASRAQTASAKGPPTFAKGRRQALTDGPSGDRGRGWTDARKLGPDGGALRDGRGGADLATHSRHL